MPSLPLDNVSERLLIAAQKSSPTALLVGGTGLALLLGHRRSLDLDIFCDRPEPLIPLVNAIEAEAESAGARVHRVRTTPGFHRLEVYVDTTTLRIDIAHETAQRLAAPKIVRGVRVAALRDQRANKLVALLGRSELRDLVDLLFIERAGLPAAAGFEDAMVKDAGMDPAWFAWALSQIQLRRLEGMVAPLQEDELWEFREELQGAILGRVGRQ